MRPTPTPLDDEALQRYLRQGYITLDAGLSADFHRGLFEEVDGLFEAEANPGNNILPRIPAIARVLDSPPVHGALQSLLGADYYLHAHRFCHYRQPRSEAQRLHKDSWSRRHHRTRWCMAFYYPQDTTGEMGPTGVVPGSQYLNSPPDPGGEIPLAGRAGTVTVVHSLRPLAPRPGQHQRPQALHAQVPLHAPRRAGGQRARSGLLRRGGPAGSPVALHVALAHGPWVPGRGRSLLR